MEVFQDYAYYYNMFYQDKDYKAEAEQADCLIKKYGNNVKNIIDFGCGTGKHDMELVGMGYHCTGIDMSQVMIDIARENAEKNKLDIDFFVDDIRNYTSDKQYDAVISLFHVMSYQNTNEDILTTFQAARTALRDGGVFLFDIWYGPGVLTDQPAIRVKEIQDDRFKLVRIATPVMHDKTDIVDVCYEVLIIDQKTNETKTIQEIHRMRYFFRPELEFYLNKVGFELIDNLDCTTLNTTNFDSWTSYFVARAI